MLLALLALSSGLKLSDKQAHGCAGFEGVDKAVSTGSICGFLNFGPQNHQRWVILRGKAMVLGTHFRIFSPNVRFYICFNHMFRIMISKDYYVPGSPDHQWSKP